MGGFDHIIKQVVASFGLNPETLKGDLQNVLRQIGEAIQRFDAHGAQTNERLARIEKHLGIPQGEPDKAQAASNNDEGKDDERPEHDGPEGERGSAGNGSEGSRSEGSGGSGSGPAEAGNHGVDASEARDSV